MTEPFFDPSEEPEAVCGNCDSWIEQRDGKMHCVNRQSINANLATERMNACALFFPDPERWPEADHE